MGLRIRSFMLGVLSQPGNAVIGQYDGFLKSLLNIIIVYFNKNLTFTGATKFLQQPGEFEGCPSVCVWEVFGSALKENF
jgi:hypothetical protein